MLNRERNFFKDISLIANVSVLPAVSPPGHPCLSHVRPEFVYFFGTRLGHCGWRCWAIGQSGRTKHRRYCDTGQRRLGCCF
ncbi:hypothetical protein GMAR_ORF18 [Golden Marseillevirus]|uniref:hypothetical protein n=1 Tax=Golden Marseillevirus TaxID=1720526 RepID=UPI000877AD05|nr:hypothetical protein GMAR_ORF18 [Golden Marseillevirus]ALX27393.1 hypothetical protein GMAR_ORF18 [Golden Marseillevirus]